MRKILSIFLATLTIAGSFHFSLATHYCGGKVADISFSLGKAEASCGMENGKAPCSEEESFGKNCCKNKIESYNGTDNYTGSFYKSFIQQTEFQIFEVALKLPELSASLLTFKKSFFHSPPNNYFSSISFLQVFRI